MYFLKNILPVLVFGTRWVVSFFELHKLEFWREFKIFTPPATPAPLSKSLSLSRVKGCVVELVEPVSGVSLVRLEPCGPAPDNDFFFVSHYQKEQRKAFPLKRKKRRRKAFPWCWGIIERLHRKQKTPRKGK